MRKAFFRKSFLLHRKEDFCIKLQIQLKEKNDLLFVWRDFNKTFCGISTYHK